MRSPENSPGSPAQWPAVSTSFGAMMVPEQRNAGLPAMSMMMRTTAGWAFPSSVPSVMKDGRPGFRSAVGTRSQLSRVTQAAARTGIAIVTRNERLDQSALERGPTTSGGLIAKLDGHGASAASHGPQPETAP